MKYVYVAVNSEGKPARGFTHEDHARAWIRINECLEYDVQTVPIEGLADGGDYGRVLVFGLVDADEKLVKLYADDRLARQEKARHYKAGYSRCELVVEMSA